jgi:HK97 family phage prohead protease
MIERRFLKNADLRAKDDGHIEGHAAVFNQEYVLYDGGNFRVVETVKPGAFTRALKEKQDVRCLMNHDPNHVLGRTASGTLKLKQDDDGLYYDCTPPDTQLGRDVVTLVKRGDISGSSFAFNVTAQTWREEKKDGVTVSTREIEDVDLFDASPVTYPAYTGTDVSARAEMRSQVLAIDTLPAEVRSTIERGKKADPECDCRCVACARDKDCTKCADHMVDCGDEKNCRCMDSRAANAGQETGEEDRTAALDDVDARLRRAGLKPTA